MRDQQHGGAEGGRRVGEAAHDVAAHRGVDGGERLVEEERPGARRERDGERDPLLLAARERLHGARRVAGLERDVAEQVLDGASARAAGTPRVLERRGQRAVHRPAGVDADAGEAVLGDAAHVGRELLLVPAGELADRPLGVGDVPRRGAHEADERAHDRRLPGARLPDDPDRRGAGRHVEVDAVHDVGASVTGREAAGAQEGGRRRAHGSPSGRRGPGGRSGLPLVRRTTLPRSSVASLTGLARRPPRTRRTNGRRGAVA